jgi:hypothetical protein
VSDTIQGYATGTYINSSFNVSYEWKWYNNTVFYSEGSTGNFTSGAEVNIANISGVFSVGDNWTFSARASNGTNGSRWSNSTVTIEPLLIDNCTINDQIAFIINTKKEIGGDSLLTNASFQITYDSQVYSFTGNNNHTYKFCKYPLNVSVSGDIYGVAESGGYNPVTFNRFDAPFEGQNYSIYLLPESIDVKEISYKVINQNNAPLQGALFNIYRVIGGVLEIVFQDTTDITGQVRTYQDTTYQYEYIISSEGFPEKNFSLQPAEQSAEPDYTIKLTPAETSYFDNPYEGIRYRHEPETILFNKTDKLVNLSFILQGEDLTEVGMRFYDHNFTCIPASCEDIIYSSNGGKVTITINMSQTGILTGAYWFKKEGGERIYVNDNKIKIVNFVEKAGKSFIDFVSLLKENSSENMINHSYSFTVEPTCSRCSGIPISIPPFSLNPHDCAVSCFLS